MKENKKVTAKLLKAGKITTVVALSTFSASSVVVPSLSSVINIHAATQTKIIDNTPKEKISVKAPNDSIVVIAVNGELKGFDKNLVSPTEFNLGENKTLYFVSLPKELSSVFNVTDKPSDETFDMTSVSNLSKFFVDPNQSDKNALMANFHFKVDASNNITLDGFESTLKAGYSVKYTNKLLENGTLVTVANVYNDNTKSEVTNFPTLKNTYVTNDKFEQVKDYNVVDENYKLNNSNQVLKDPNWDSVTLDRLNGIYHTQAELDAIYAKRDLDQFNASNFTTDSSSVVPVEKQLSVLVENPNGETVKALSGVDKDATNALTNSDKTFLSGDVKVVKNSAGKYSVVGLKARAGYGVLTYKVAQFANGALGVIVKVVPTNKVDSTQNTQSFADIFRDRDLFDLNKTLVSKVSKDVTSYNQVFVNNKLVANNSLTNGTGTIAQLVSKLNSLHVKFSNASRKASGQVVENISVVNNKLRNLSPLAGFKITGVRYSTVNGNNVAKVSVANTKITVVGKYGRKTKTVANANLVASTTHLRTASYKTSHTSSVHFSGKVKLNVKLVHGKERYSISGVSANKHYKIVSKTVKVLKSGDINVVIKVAHRR